MAIGRERDREKDGEREQRMENEIGGKDRRILLTIHLQRSNSGVVHIHELWKLRDRVYSRVCLTVINAYLLYLTEQ